MKPIHKFNNGNGATICNKCHTIISTGLTNDLLCKDCLKKFKVCPDCNEVIIPVSHSGSLNYTEYSCPCGHFETSEIKIILDIWNAKQLLEKIKLNLELWKMQ